ncbi:putative ribonuclease H-like domain-containing protein [Tanacetum coccineum]
MGMNYYKNLDGILNSQMSARDKNGLEYSTQLNELSSNHETNSENSLSIFDVRSNDEENTPENDRFSKNGYKVVPPPITWNFLTLRADISFTGLDEYAIRNKIIESQKTELNTKTSETAGQTNAKKTKSASKSVVSNPKLNRDKVIIEDCNSDDEEEEYKVQTVRLETQIVKTRDDKSGVLTRIGLHRPVNTVRPVCTARPSVSTARPVCTARPSVSTVRPVCTTRPNVSTARSVCTARPSVSTARHVPSGGLEVKNLSMNEFCANKGIKREFSVARTPQQNGVAERKNRTLIEAARTMLADSLLPIQFWVEVPSGKDKGPTRNYILLPPQPHRTRIPIEDVAPAAHEKPFESFPKENDVQDSEDAATKESEQDLQDELEKMLSRFDCKAMDDFLRDKLLKKKRGELHSQKKELQLQVYNTLVLISHMSNTPYVSAASTSTGANAGESSFKMLLIPLQMMEIQWSLCDVRCGLHVADFNNTCSNKREISKGLFSTNKPEEPKTISQALQDESWVEAMQEELLQFKLQFMIGSLMYLTTSRPDIMFAVCACARFQVTPKASHLNAVKRIFRDCYKKRLIEVIKIHIDSNVADLLTKGFDVTRFNFLVTDLANGDVFHSVNWVLESH